MRDYQSGLIDATDSPAPEWERRAPGKQPRTRALVQRRARSAAEPTAAQARSSEATTVAPPFDDAFGLHLAAARGVDGAAAPLPFADQIQDAFGTATDVASIRARVGGPASDACDRLGASAYATGTSVAFASAPDLHTAAHEAAHVVQQARGVACYGGVGAVGDAFEVHADQVADGVVAGQSVEALLLAGPTDGARGPTIQRQARPGGDDPRGDKEHQLLAWRDDIVAVTAQLAADFAAVGVQFRPQILLGIAMHESDARDPLTYRSFDDGLGLMQITPTDGKLDPEVARAIGWDNAKGLEANIRDSAWRDPRANLRAGAHTLLGKARAIRGAVPSLWAQMDDGQRWRAILFAYNAGEGSAIAALERGGPAAPMISTFVGPDGATVSHDYVGKVQADIDYVDGHDPFGGAALLNGLDDRVRRGVGDALGGAGRILDGTGRALDGARRTLDGLLGRHKELGKGTPLDQDPQLDQDPIGTSKTKGLGELLRGAATGVGNDQAIMTDQPGDQVLVGTSRSRLGDRLLSYRDRLDDLTPHHDAPGDRLEMREVRFGADGRVDPEITYPSHLAVPRVVIDGQEVEITTSSPRPILDFVGGITATDFTIGLRSDPDNEAHDVGRPIVAPHLMTVVQVEPASGLTVLEKQAPMTVALGGGKTALLYERLVVLHLDAVMVDQGAVVNTAQQIGTQGRTQTKDVHQHIAGSNNLRIDFINAQTRAFRRP